MSKTKALALIAIGCLVMAMVLKGDVVFANPQDPPPGHDEHGGEEAVSLSPEEIEEFEIVIEPVGGGNLHHEITLPGEVRLDQDRLAHVVPRLSGVVAEVYKTLGDTVRGDGRAGQPGVGHHQSVLSGGARTSFPGAIDVSARRRS